MIPCEQEANIAEIRTDVSHLREWEAKQNGSLVKMTEEVGNLRIAVARTEEQTIAIHNTLKEMKENATWTRRLLYTTTASSLAALAIGALGKHLF